MAIELNREVILVENPEKYVEKERRSYIYLDANDLAFGNKTECEIVNNIELVMFTKFYKYVFPEELKVQCQRRYETSLQELQDFRQGVRQNNYSFLSLLVDCFDQAKLFDINVSLAFTGFEELSLAEKKIVMEYAQYFDSVVLNTSKTDTISDSYIKIYSGIEENKNFIQNGPTKVYKKQIKH